jgi:1,4-dihydroxy-2-naphthoate octaprenyltransferase
MSKLKDLKLETMMVGQEGYKFEIKSGSIIQLKNKDDWFDSVCVCQYILEGIAYLSTPAHQDWGLYKLGIYNCSNVTLYTYDN